MSGGGLSVAVYYNLCANGETYEFWLTLGGRRIGTLGIFRSVGANASAADIRAAAASVLQDLIRRAAVSPASPSADTRPT